jgi:hypothetical protein
VSDTNPWAWALRGQRRYRWSRRWAWVATVIMLGTAAFNAQVVFFTSGARQYLSAGLVVMLLVLTWQLWRTNVALGRVTADSLARYEAWEARHGE